MFDSFFNYIFGFLINWNKFIALLIISFILTLITTLIFKFLTDQHLMKTLKEEIKLSQQEAKNHKNNPKKPQRKILTLRKIFQRNLLKCFRIFQNIHEII